MYNQITMKYTNIKENCAASFVKRPDFDKFLEIGRGRRARSFNWNLVPFTLSAVYCGGLRAASDFPIL